MKKLFTLTVVLIVIVLQASAQLKKGEKMLGGSLGISSNELKQTYSTMPSAQKTKTTSVLISPHFGIGLGNNWIVGLMPGFTYSGQRQSNGLNQLENRVYGISPGVFVRKFSTIGERFGIFGQGNVSYGFTKYKSRQDANPWTEYKQNSFGVSLKPGAYFKPTKRFVIEATIGNIGYSRTTSKPEINPGSQKSTSESLDFTLTNSLSLGFNLVF